MTAKSEMATLIASKTYTIIETVELNGLNPEACPRAVIVRIADHPMKGHRRASTELDGKMKSNLRPSSRSQLIPVLLAVIGFVIPAFPQAQMTPAPVPAAATTKKGVQAAQERLQALGYQVGSADGVMGLRSIAALKKFQSDRGLSATGLLDEKTLAVLGVKQGKPAAEKVEFDERA